MLAAAIVDSGPTGITTLVKAGDGTWLLSGANTYSGATTVQAGTLRLASGGEICATSAATTITGDVGGTGSLALTGGITFSPEPITLQARQDLTAPIPHLVNSSGDNHWTGPITFTSGGFEYTLQSDAGTLIIDSDITQSIASLERILNLQGGGNGVVNGAIINGGGTQTQVVRKRGAGTWTLNGANTYRGATIVEQGTLLANSGLTGPGPTIVGTGKLAATLVVNGMQQSSVTVGGASRVNPRAGSATAVVASLSLAGTPDTPTATVDLTDRAPWCWIIRRPVPTLQRPCGSRSSLAAAAAVWASPGMDLVSPAARRTDVVTSPNSTSVGYAVNGDLPLGAYTNFRGQPVDPTSVLIRYTRTADANLDGLVNDNDVTIVGANYAPGIPKAAWALGDFDYNGFVDDDDVTLLGVFYNPGATPIPAPEAVAPGSATLARGSAGGQSGAATVPEPASWLLLTLSARLPCSSAVDRATRAWANQIDGLIAPAICSIRHLPA